MQRGVHPLLRDVADAQARSRRGNALTRDEARRTVGALFGRAPRSGMAFRRGDYRPPSGPPQSSGTIAPHTPGLGERLSNALYGLGTALGFSPTTANRMREEAGYVPIIGDVLTAGEAANAYGQGNYLGGTALAALAGIGLIPGAGDAVAGAGRAAVRGTTQALRGGPIRAYHGSPHAFDRFELSPRTIGTGEGAQAYGHGLYFAGSEGTARSYRDTLGYRGAAVDGVPVGTHSPDHHYWAARGMAASDGGDIEKAVSFLDSRSPTDAGMARSIQRARELIESGRARPMIDGHMYEVNINADPDSLLDWDRPLGEQPEVARRLGWSDEGLAAYREAQAADTDALLAALTSDADYRPARLPVPNGLPDLSAPGMDVLRSRRGSRDLYVDSSPLRDAGIPGIQYLDQGSRAAGDGTRNYVVFDQDIIEILRRYGLAGGMIGTGAVAASGGEGPGT